jgi:polyhydroxybutyrate depolymerase
MPRSKLLGLVIVVISLACTALPAAAHDAWEKFDSGGFSRTATVFVPDRLANSGHPLPMVVVLHGGLETGAIIRRQMRMDEIAERNGFMVVYPDGLWRGWNDGRADRMRQRGPFGRADDVAFLRALIQKLEHDGLADPSRVYLTGVSNGGMMSLRMACDAPELFAGVAPIIANLPAELIDRCGAGHPVPMLIINGTADPLVPFDGGGVGFAGGRGEVISTEETVALWRRINGCKDEAKRSAVAPKQAADPSRAKVLLYNDCRSGAPVALVRIDGGGHRIPGSETRWHPLIDRLLGAQNHDFETADIVWQFFARPSGS